METDISASTSRPYLVPSITGIVCLGVGLGLGYLWGKRNGSVEVLVPENEPENPNVFWADDEEGISPEQLLKVVAYNEADVAATEELVQVVVEEKYERKSVFMAEDDLWDQETELQSRNPEITYIISKQEFIDDDMGFVQSTLTYYEGDNVLVDEREQPIVRHERLIPELRFGHGSGDPNVFYARNEKMHIEWEILRSEGHYLVEVMGQELEHDYEEQDLKHSKDRRFKDWD